jgi:hypothetical protein
LAVSAKFRAIDHQLLHKHDRVVLASLITLRMESTKIGSVPEAPDIYLEGESCGLR